MIIFLCYHDHSNIPAVTVIFTECCKIVRLYVQFIVRLHIKLLLTLCHTCRLLRTLLETIVEGLVVTSINCSFVLKVFQPILEIIVFRNISFVVYIYIQFSLLQKLVLSKGLRRGYLQKYKMVIRTLVGWRKNYLFSRMWYYRSYTVCLYIDGVPCFLPQYS